MSDPTSPADIMFVEGDLVPSAPVEGKILFYAKTNGSFYSMDSVGAEKRITPNPNSAVYDIALTVPGTVENSDLLVFLPITLNVVYRITNSRSAFLVTSAPFSTVIFGIERNNIPIGTVTVSGGQTTGVFSMIPTQDIEFVPGDTFIVRAPSDVFESGLSGIGAVFAMDIE